MKRLLHLLLICIISFSGGFYVHAQKAKNLVYNGDLELIVDSMWILKFPQIEYKYNEVYGCPTDTQFNLSFDNLKYRLRSLEYSSMANAGKVGSCFDRAKYDVMRNDQKILKLVTGRVFFDSGYPPYLSGTYGNWTGAKISFALTDTVQQGELIYIEWMDFFADDHSPYDRMNQCWQPDSLPDSVQVGLCLDKYHQGTVVYTGAAGYKQWATHSSVLNCPIKSGHITLGNQGAVNALTPYMPHPSGSGTGWPQLSASNYFDNLRLFRVLGTSSRDTMLCGPGPFVLPGKAGKEWAWNDSLFTQNIPINLGDSGWYINKTFTDGYVRIDSLYVRFDKAYSPQSAQDTVGCTGQIVTLTSPRSTGFTYLWSDNSTNANTSVNSPGSYWVQSKKGTCTLIDTFHVQFAPKPVVYIGADTAFCGSFVYLLNAGPNKKEYTWNTGAKTSTLNVNTPGQYHVTVKDSLNCPNADTIQLEQITLNPITITEDTITCQHITLTGSPQQNKVSYTWSTGQTGLQIQVTQTGNYILTAQHPYCSLQQSVTVNTLPQPPQVNLGSDTTLCGYNSIVLENKNNNLPNYSYYWSTGERSEKILISDSGQYILTIYRNQCKNSDTVEVAPNCEGTYYVPTAFSPNGDGLNETFSVAGTNIQHVSMRLYNRWGEEVFSADGKDVSWDGTFKQQPCAPEVYAYSIVVTAKNKQGLRHQLSGTVTLMR